MYTEMMTRGNNFSPKFQCDLPENMSREHIYTWVQSVATHLQHIFDIQKRIQKQLSQHKIGKVKIRRSTKSATDSSDFVDSGTNNLGCTPYPNSNVYETSTHY